MDSAIDGWWCIALLPSVTGGTDVVRC